MLIAISDISVQNAYIMVDEMHQKCPELVEDKYWDIPDVQIPYTEASKMYKKSEFIGSTMELR